MMALRHAVGSLLAGAAMRAPQSRRIDRLISTASHQQFKIVVIGCGSAGALVSADLGRHFGPNQVAVVEPRDVHSYQPGWTLVGAGMREMHETQRPMAEIVSRHVTWVRDAVAAVDASQRLVTTRTGRSLRYDFLILAPGLECRWTDTPGLTEALGDGAVTSNYHRAHAEHTWEYVRRLRRGRALFTFPSTPVKCGGAGQKAAYCADDHWRAVGVRDSVSVTYATALPRVFHVPHYASALEALCAERSIDVLPLRDLVEVRGRERVAVFERLDGGGLEELPYDLLHVVPRQGPAAWLRESGLSDAAGWIDVDRATLRHARHANVFAIGDATNLPTSKTAAAVAAQFTVLRANVLEAAAGFEPSAAYDGYTSCPIVAGREQLMLMEFDYSLQPVETFPWDQRQLGGKRGAFMFWLKRDFLPWAYWNHMVRGRVPWRELPEMLGFQKRLPMF